MCPAHAAAPSSSLSVLEPPLVLQPQLEASQPTFDMTVFRARLVATAPV
jgi:hypothetical protein